MALTKQSSKDTGTSLDDWMRGVDILVTRAVGFSIHDLPDMDFWSEWDSGRTVVSFAREIVENIEDIVLS